MTTYFIQASDGKTERVDTCNLIELYADGRMRGGRPSYFYMTKSKKRFFIEHQTHWQGEHPSIMEVSREEMIQELTQAKHPDRAAEGLALMGATDEIPEVE